MTFRLRGLLLLPILSTALHSQKLPVPVRTEIAPGIFLFATPPYGDAGLDGNSVVIVGDDGVLVFDANGTPAAAAAVLDQIRTITSKPVKYLVHSHWHWDHSYGVGVYKEAFPNLEIIAHEKTRQLMDGPFIAFNQPFVDTDLPEHIKSLEDRLATAPDSLALREHAAQDRWFLDQKRGAAHPLATRTFTDSLTLRLGSRVVQVLHYDRAITPGDAFLYLPAERIAVTGDLLINPLTFALFCYPAGWIRTLERIDALDAKLLVPGHGAPMQDEAHLKATLALLKRETLLGRTAKAAGRTVAEAQEAVLADSTVRSLRTTITGGVAARNDAFALYLVEWFVKRLYQELDGPLDDSIPAMP